MNWINKFFKPKKSETPIEIISNEISEWFEFEKQKPPHAVVLAACESYDCGWIMDTAWWSEDDQCWFVTGTVKTKRAHMPYTHWRKLPPYPNGEE